MSSMPCSPTVCAFSLLVYLILSFSICRAQIGQWLSSPSEMERHDVFMLWRDHPNMQQCGVCHYSPGNEFAKRETDFCRLTELRQWLESDRHAIARQRVEPIDPKSNAPAAGQSGGEALQAKTSDVSTAGWIRPSNYLSYAICQQMGYDVATDVGYAQFRENCMTCHGGYQATAGVAGFSRDSSNVPGISCSYCHQAGADNRWIDQHSSLTAKASWRTLTPPAKAALGMRDLVSVGSRAELCLSCHMGNIEQHKFVTHQMYAAGHPPLPSMELSTFTDAMPRHWLTQAERAKSLAAYPQRAAYFLNTYPALRSLSEPSAEAAGKLEPWPPVDFSQLPWQTETLVGGALAAQQNWLRLVIQAAQTDDSQQVVAWGDYAFYDCAACHHDLRKPSDRQALRRSGPPGRPRFLEWPQSLAKAISLISPMREVFLAHEQQLSQAVLERPFGNRQAVWRSASTLSATIEQIEAETAGRWWTEDFNKELIKSLTRTSDEMLVDYHTARQLIWSLRCLDAELARLGRPLPADVRQLVAKLGYAPEANMDFTASLPSGLGHAIFPDYLQAELHRQASYDGRILVGQLRKLADAVRVSLP